MMYQMKKLPYNYIPELGLQILELSYVDEELSMFILLPEESADGSDPVLKVHNLQTTTSKEKPFFLVHFGSVLKGALWSFLVKLCLHSVFLKQTNKQSDSPLSQFELMEKKE